MYKHSILVRSNNGLHPALLPSVEVVHESDEPQEDIIRACDDIAKGLVTPQGMDKALRVDAVIYQVNGVTEYFISRYFYLWPNFTDREERGKRPVRKGR